VGLIYSAAIWGSTFFIVKICLKDINPVILVAYRFLLASMLLALFLILNKKNIFKDIKKGFFLGVFLWVLYIPQTIGLIYTTSSNSAFITGLFVVFLPLFVFIFYRRFPSILKTIAVIISIIGLWFLTGGLREINRGDLMTLITAMAYAAHILFVDKFMKDDADPYILSFQQFFFVGILSVITGVIFKLPFNVSSTLAIWIVLFLALFPTLSAFVIQLVAQKFTSPIKVSLIFALEPVFAAIFSWTLGNEEFFITIAFGGLLIFIAIVLSELPANKRISEII